MPRRGLPETVRMRHDEHYVEALAASAGAPIGRMVPIEQIDPNPAQPRQMMGDLSELVASIAEKGILEPLVVRQRGDRYQIVAGERRYQAAVQAGLRPTARGLPGCRRHRGHRAGARREPPAKGPDAVRGGRRASGPGDALRIHPRGARQEAQSIANVDYGVADAHEDTRRGSKPLSAGRHFI